MSRRHGNRILSREEQWIWTRVSSTYKPLKKKQSLPNAKAMPSDFPKEFIEEQKAHQTEGALSALTVADSVGKAAKENKKSNEIKVPKRGVNQQALQPISSLERKTTRSLRRGTMTIDAVLDLHGMRQTEAHYSLLSFLRRSQARGASMVLVITGKGSADSGFHSGENERGVLKRNVPNWLNMPEARSLVVSFGEAAQQHGGKGALYVRLRRQKS